MTKACLTKEESYGDEEAYAKCRVTFVKANVKMATKKERCYEEADSCI